MTALCDLRKILRAAQTRQYGGALKNFSGTKNFYGMLGLGVQLKRRPPDSTHQNKGDYD
jgi:hypothetical protein